MGSIFKAESDYFLGVIDKFWPRLFQRSDDLVRFKGLENLTLPLYYTV